MWCVLIRPNASTMLAPGPAQTISTPNLLHSGQLGYFEPREYNSKSGSMDHIASWQVVISERNKTRGHTRVRAMATTCPSKSGHYPVTTFQRRCFVHFDPTRSFQT